MTRHPANDYIGIPFRDGGRDRDGVDCWGLVRLYYRERYRHELPSFEIPVGQIREIMRRVRDEERSGRWQRLDEPEEGAIVTMAHAEHSHHLGLWVGGMVMHVTRSTGFVVAQTLRSLGSSGFGRIQFYRYAGGTGNG